MKMIFKKYDYLCEDAKLIRLSVFVDEQGFENEFDETDDKAAHLVFYIDDSPAAVCRYYLDDLSDLNEGVFHIGRVAVLKAFRGRNLGRQIMEAAEAEIIKDGGKVITLSAQTRVKEFYEKSGYVQVGEEYYDEFCPHIKMEKKLKPQGN